MVTKAVSSTSNTSIWAVPSMNKSLNSNEDAPKSLAPSVEGTKSLSNLPVAVIVSDVASPKSTLPLTVKLPVTVAFSSTCKVSMVAVPSKNKFCHSLVAAPIFLLPSTSGIRLLPTDVNVDTPDIFSLLLVAVSYTHLTLPTNREV